MSDLLATSYSLLQPSFSNRIVDSCYNVITVNVHEKNIRRRGHGNTYEGPHQC